MMPWKARSDEMRWNRKAEMKVAVTDNDPLNARILKLATDLGNTVLAKKAANDLQAFVAPLRQRTTVALTWILQDQGEKGTRLHETGNLPQGHASPRSTPLPAASMSIRSRPLRQVGAPANSAGRGGGGRRRRREHRLGTGDGASGHKWGSDGLVIYMDGASKPGLGLAFGYVTKESLYTTLCGLRVPRLGPRDGCWIWSFLVAALADPQQELFRELFSEHESANGQSRRWHDYSPGRLGSAMGVNSGGCVWARVACGCRQTRQRQDDTKPARRVGVW